MKIQSIFQQKNLLQIIAISFVTGSGLFAQKPNIIYILADDLGYGDLSCYGQEKFSTPNIDKLAEQGMKFTRHYAGSTVCAPSRSCLLTGEHTGHTPVRGNNGAELPTGYVSIGTVMKKAGYATGVFGKWGLGSIDKEGVPWEHGIDEFCGYLSQVRAHSYYIDYIYENDQKLYLDGNDGGHTVTYAADVIHEKALSFIDRNKDNPFFLYCPYIIPHAELIVPDDTILSKMLLKDYPDDVPYINPAGDYNPLKPKTDWGKYCSQEKVHTTYASMVYRLDVYVGQIMQKLIELGIEDNTIIMFSSDNGPHSAGGNQPEFFNSNGELRGIKRDLYEGGIRVPFIASWPGKIAPNTQTDHISAFWDFLPTCAGIAGVDVEKEIDGISFLPTLLGDTENQLKHEFLYWEFYEAGGRRAVISENWKGVQYNMDTNPNAHVQVFNLTEDGSEENDIASGNPEIQAKLHNLLETNHIQSDNLNFPYENNNNYKVTFTFINELPEQNDISVELTGYGTRICEYDGVIVYDGISPRNDIPYVIKVGNQIANEGLISVTNSDQIKSIELKLINLTFEITDGNNPIGGAEIQLEGYGTLTSDISGKVLFENVFGHQGIGYTVIIGDKIIQEWVVVAEGNDLTETVVYSPNVSVNNNGISHDLILYPNPVSGNLYVSTNDLIQDINIYSIKGVKEMEVSHKDTIDVSMLKSGTYFILIKTDKKEYFRKIIIE